jgi:hypothetical protein
VLEVCDIGGIRDFFSCFMSGGPIEEEVANFTVDVKRKPPKNLDVEGSWAVWDTREFGLG